MQSLIAVIFKKDMDRAAACRAELQGDGSLADLLDSANMVLAVCGEDGKTRVVEPHAMSKDGALVGGVWGGIIGLLFLNPLLGAVAGAGLGAAAGEMGDFGISHRFMKELATHLKPGTSALFVPVRHKDVDETVRRLEKTGGIVLSTDLNLEGEQQMERLFDELTAETPKPAANS